MELFKGQSLLEFTERFKTDLDYVKHFLYVLKGLENIKIKITNEIEDEYNIKQQIKKEDGDKERAKEEKRKKK